MGQLCDGSYESLVTKDDPFPYLQWTHFDMIFIQQQYSFQLVSLSSKDGKDCCYVQSTDEG